MVSLKEEIILIKKLKSSKITANQYQYVVDGTEASYERFEDNDDIHAKKGELCIHNSDLFDTVIYHDTVKDGDVFELAYQSHLGEMFSKFASSFGLVKEVIQFLKSHLNDVLDNGSRPIHFCNAIAISDNITIKQKTEVIDYILSIPDILLHPINAEFQTPLTILTDYQQHLKNKYNSYLVCHEAKYPLLVDIKMSLLKQTQDKLLSIIRERECKYGYLILFLILFQRRERESFLPIPAEILIMIWNKWTPFQCKECQCYHYFCNPCKSIHCECLKWDE